jgi:SAM-dependent methyltransferase
LLRSDPVLNIDLDKLYEESTFDYSSEVEGLKRAYVGIVKKALSPRKPAGAVLEIGGGNGFFLEAALDAGFDSIEGIEPSVKAVAASRGDIKPHMKIGMMGPGVVKDNSFDVVVMFHVMDHLPDPLDVVKCCVSALKPGGTFVVAVHNERSWSSRLLRAKSPIVDVEHTYLYSKVTGEKLFKRAGLVNIKQGAYWNLYSLAYLIHLIPIPKSMKMRLLQSRMSPIFESLKISVPLGNIWVSGQKPLE